MFIDIINKYFTDLSDSDLELSKYILENYTAIANMSVNELAENNYTSKSSVIRFCQRIGFSGYTELKNYIKWDASIENNQIKSHSTRDYVTADIRKTLNYIQESNWTDIYEELKVTSKVYIIPTGHTQQSQASELHRLFLLMNIRVEIINNVASTNEFKRILEIAEDNTLFILLSYSGENENLIKLHNELNLRSFTTIAITGMNNNTIASNATYNLYASTTKSPASSEWWIQTSSSFFLLIEAFAFGFLDYSNSL